MLGKGKCYTSLLQLISVESDTQELPKSELVKDLGH
jgi:hypothetical protein